MPKEAKSVWKAWLALGVAGLALVAALVVVSQKPAPRIATKSPDKAAEEEETPSGPIGQAKPGYKEVGGVYRPEVDVNYPERKTATVSTPKPLIDMGKSPAVNPDANPAVASVYEALKTRKNPERFSSFVMPAKFDAKAFQADPESYVGVVEPGRVFQPAQPSPDVKPIQVKSKRYQRVTQGDQVVLSVKADAGAPVTFTSFDLGHFENQLTSTTVRANDSGEAVVRYTAASGTIDQVEILAASPLNSGQARFVVNVKLPKPNAG